jgi:hypothetical protein
LTIVLCDLINSQHPLVKKADGSLELAIPRYSPTTSQAVTWVGHDLGPSALALFKNYERQDIKGQVFHVVTAQLSYNDLAKIFSKGLS